MNKKEIELRFKELADNNAQELRTIREENFDIHQRIHTLETRLREYRIVAACRPLNYDDIRYELRLKIVKGFYKGLKGVVHGRQKAKWFTAAKVHVTLEGIGVVTFTLDQVALDDGVSL